MTSVQIQQLQTQLGVPLTGVLDDATTAAYNSAVGKAIGSDPNVKQYGGNNNPSDILNAYNTGDYSGVTSLTGKPFTDAQQQAAVAASQAALAPAYNAQVTNDTETTTQALQKNQQDLADTELQSGRQFALDKNSLDTNAATNGVLYAGSRLQQQNNLRNTYNTADAIANRAAQNTAATDTRNYAYTYGSPAAQKLSPYYNLNGPSTYNANVAAYQPGAVTPSSNLSSLYSPSASNYQGTAPAAQSAAVQTRAGGLLQNQANKLTLNGYANSL